MNKRCVIMSNITTVTPNTTWERALRFDRLIEIKISKDSTSPIFLTNRFLPPRDKNNSSTPLKKSFKSKEEIHNSFDRIDNSYYNHNHLKMSGIIFNILNNINPM